MLTIMLTDFSSLVLFTVKTAESVRNDLLESVGRKEIKPGLCHQDACFAGHCTEDGDFWYCHDWRWCCTDVTLLVVMMVAALLVVLEVMDWWWWWWCCDDGGENVSGWERADQLERQTPVTPRPPAFPFSIPLFQIQLHVCQYQDIFPSPIKFSDEPVCFLNVFVPFSLLLYAVAFIGYVQWSSCVHLGALRVPHKCDQSPCNVFLLGPHCRYLCTFCFFHLAWMALLFHCVLYIFVLYNVVGPDIMGLPCCAAQCCTDSPGHITVGVDWFQPLVVPGQTAIITLRSCCYCSRQSKRTIIGCCISEEC